MIIHPLMPDQRCNPTAVSDYPAPYAYQFRGQAWARWVIGLLGWKLHFQGFPALQGVIVVYPHTSNWDAPLMFLAKWALGVQVVFWGKDSLFKLPLLGRWLRWIGGVPVRRTAATGLVQQALAMFAQHKAAQQYYWLGLSPEGTRKFLPGWRSGFYQTAHGAQVPLCLIKLDYGRRDIRVEDFIALTGDQAQDMARIAGIYSGVRGLKPALMTPVQMLDPRLPRADTVVR
jgi:1-acyl-sn-glycerol-3-phosphate acyltransferase